MAPVAPHCPRVLGCAPQEATEKLVELEHPVLDYALLVNIQIKLDQLRVHFVQLDVTE
jgi:hypothetical protein